MAVGVAVRVAGVPIANTGVKALDRCVEWRVLNECRASRSRQQEQMPEYLMTCVHVWRVGRHTNPPPVGNGRVEPHLFTRHRSPQPHRGTANRGTCRDAGAERTRL